MENYKLKKKYTNLKVYIKMEKTIIKSDDIEMEKQKFHQHKRPILINNIDINKIVVSNKVSFSKKGFEYCMHISSKNECIQNRLWRN